MDWSHPMHEECAQKVDPDKTHFPEAEQFPTQCCYCGNASRSMVYVMYDPAALPCKGDHSQFEVPA